MATLKNVLNKTQDLIECDEEQLFVFLILLCSAQLEERAVKFSMAASSVNSSSRFRRRS